MSLSFPGVVDSVENGKTRVSYFTRKDKIGSQKQIFKIRNLSK